MSDDGGWSRCSCSATPTPGSRCHVISAECRSTTREHRCDEVYFAHLGTGVSTPNSARSRTGRAIHSTPEVDEPTGTSDGEEKSHCCLVASYHRTRSALVQSACRHWPFDSTMVFVPEAVLSETA